MDRTLVDDVQGGLKLVLNIVYEDYAEACDRAELLKDTWGTNFTYSGRM
jgi:hypothetical protein